MNRVVRKIVVAVAAIFGLAVVLLVLVPVFFGDRIASRIKAEVNRSLDARVDWRDAGLGLFRNFPNLTLRLDDLTVVGIGKFDGDTLASVGHLGIVLDLASAARSILGGSEPIVVRAVELDRSRLSLVALEDGIANWDIMKATPSAAEPGRPLTVSLRRFTIDDGTVTFDNRAAKLHVSLLGLDQTLTGDFGNDQVDVVTRAEVDTMTVLFAGVPYLNRVRLDLTANVAADLTKRAFTLRQGSGLRLNDLLLAASGTVASAGERLRMDLAFQAPKTDFKHILSLVPVIYARDFQSVQASGTLAVSGRINGDYGGDAFPSFFIGAKVDNGTFRYPDLPLGARDIFLDLAITNPGGHADSTVVNLRRLHVMLGQNPLDAKLVLRTPIADPDIDARATGRVELADLRRTVKLEGMQELAGRISADAVVRARMSWIARREYDRITASGTVDVSNLAVKSAALPRPLAIREASLRLAAGRTELRSFVGTIGSSDLRASGYLENLLGYALRDEQLRGSATLTSSKVDLNEWRSDNGALSVIPVPPGIDFGLQADVGELLYDKLRMMNAHGRLRIKDQRLTLDDFAVSTLGGRIGVTGFYETTVPAKPTFDLGLRIEKLDIPAAFATLTTVQQLAPVARYAQGNFSAGLQLNGSLGKDMMPLFETLSGTGTLQTSQLLIRDFPALEKAAAATKLAFLNDPTLQALRSQFDIRDGRLHIRPFSVGLGRTTMTVSGSNGLDQSLDYDLNLRVPRDLIGAEANQAIASLVSRAASAGIDLATASEIPLGIRITGPVANPSIKTDLGRSAESAARDAGEAVRAAAEKGAAAAVDEVRQRAGAETERLVREAAARAAEIRTEARTLAEKVKREGYQAADSLLSRSRNPIARIAAEAAAGRLRKEADDKSDRIIREAGARADALVAEARTKGGASSP